MCGIFVEIRSDNAVKKTVEGLKQLEYRGYDSYGVYCVNSDMIFKGVGPISDAEQIIDNSKTCIGHTRWATHGEVNYENAHPHKVGDIVLVHNGTIDGIAGPYTSDSYALASMCNDIYKESSRLEEFMESIEKLVPNDNVVVGCIVGGFYRGHIFGIVKGNKPLYIGNKYHSISSSIDPLGKAAVLCDCHFIIDCWDGLYEPGTNMLIMCKDGKFTAKDYFNDLETVQAVKNFSLPTSPHRMLSEIKGQETLFSDYVHEHAFTSNNNILIGCGSSWHAALYGATIGGYPNRAEYASEFRYRAQNKTKSMFPESLIAITQSGETKDVIDCTKAYDSKNVTVITNNPPAYFGDTKLCIPLNVGTEYGVAATKTFTATCLALRSMFGKGTDDAIRSIQYAAKNIDLVKSVASRLTNSSNCLFLGRGVNYPIALEGALKLKEVSYIHAEGMPAAEMKHGPIALIDSAMPVIFIVTEEDYKGNVRQFGDISANISEVKARGGRVAVFCDAYAADKIPADLCEEVIVLPVTGKGVELGINVLLQALAYYTAVEKGINPDRPRNLSKCVTV